MDSLIEPIAQQLQELLSDFPLTIIYVESLESLGYFYQYLEMKENAYIGDPVPQNRIFAQYHADYPDSIKKL